MAGRTAGVRVDGLARVDAYGTGDDARTAPEGGELRAFHLTTSTCDADKCNDWSTLDLKVVVDGDTRRLPDKSGGYVVAIPAGAAERRPCDEGGRLPPVPLVAHRRAGGRQPRSARTPGSVRQDQRDLHVDRDHGSRSCLRGRRSAPDCGARCLCQDGAAQLLRRLVSARLSAQRLPRRGCHLPPPVRRGGPPRDQDRGHEVPGRRRQDLHGHGRREPGDESRTGSSRSPRPSPVARCSWAAPLGRSPEATALHTPTRCHPRRFPSASPDASPQHSVYRGPAPQP